MQLEYFGHSFWKVSSGNVSIVIDPFDEIGYPLPEDLRADYVIVSHEHHDHNNTSLVKGNPKIIRKSGLHPFSAFIVELLPVYHDTETGSKRGKNNIINLSIDGLKLVHCGDLGHIPPSGVMEKIHKPDVLLIPVGEVYTLSINDAWDTINALQPKLLIPMHYSTPHLSFRIGNLNSFLQGREDVIRHNSCKLQITEELLSTPGIIVMDWSAGR